MDYFKFQIKIFNKGSVFYKDFPGLSETLFK